MMMTPKGDRQQIVLRVKPTILDRFDRAARRYHTNRNALVTVLMKIASMRGFTNLEEKIRDEIEKEDRRRNKKGPSVSAGK
jgi:hypothetical protein